MPFSGIGSGQSTDGQFMMGENDKVGAGLPERPGNSVNMAFMGIFSCM
jgi:hypothetical protein